MMVNKYHARKCKVNGMSFDSNKEARRYGELQYLQKAGQISNLRRQVKFELIPTQYETVKQCKKTHKNSKKERKLIERSCSYIADFVYEENGKIVVEDVKGLKTEVYKIKRKLMLKVHGIRIREI